MPQEDSVSLVALVVSLIALIIALGQLLTQIFGTVEGFRRCQPSVLGKFWANKTKRNWRWSQFRIEILFTTPEVALSSIRPAASEDYFSKSQTTDEALEGPRAQQKPVNELVCWIPLLRSLDEVHSKFGSGIQISQDMQNPNTNQAGGSDIGLDPLISWPTLFPRQRSWDFMPPDVVRPFASTTLSDIAILARRMGMMWTEFRPAEGVLEARGGGHVFSGTTVRGIGLMLNYRRLELGISDYIVSTLTSQRKFMSGSAVPDALVCTVHTDLMWFGILPGNVELKLPSLEIGTNEDIYNTLMALDPSERAANSLRDLQREDSRRLHGFCDIVPMVAPWLRRPLSTLNQYPRPCAYTYGLTWYRVGYHVFYRQLEQYHAEGHGTESSSDDVVSTRWVQMKYLHLRNTYPKWDFINSNPGAGDVLFLNELQTIYQQTTEYFMAKAPKESDTPEERANKINYLDLVTSHIREAPRSYHDAMNHVGTPWLRETDPMGDRLWRGEAMRFYWDYMPDYVGYMNYKGCSNEELVKEAWIILMFRAFLWQRAHSGIDNEPPLPSRFYGSRLPVYIG